MLKSWVNPYFEAQVPPSEAHEPFFDAQVPPSGTEVPHSDEQMPHSEALSLVMKA